MKKITLALFLLVFTSCAPRGIQHNDMDFLNLNKAHFLSKIEVVDDEFETEVKISTQKCYYKTYGLLNVVWDDVFLRGFISKETKQKIYQVYVIKRYKGSGWLNPYQANFGSPIKGREINVIDTDVDCITSSIGVECTYLEQFTFDITEEEITSIIDKINSQVDVNKIWSFRVKNKSGEDYMESLSLYEIEAFLEKMKLY